MATLIPINSVLDRMMSLSRAMDSSFDQNDADIFGLRTPPSQRVWLPALDSWESNDAFIVAMDIPGVHSENLDISFEQNTLTVKGMRSSPINTSEKTESRVFMSERMSGSFSRALRLPEYVDGEKIEASYDSGVLTIRIPKMAAAVPRKISISAKSAGK